MVGWYVTKPGDISSLLVRFALVYHRVWLPAAEWYPGEEWHVTSNMAIHIHLSIVDLVTRILRQMRSYRLVHDVELTRTCRGKPD